MIVAMRVALFTKDGLNKKWFLNMLKLCQELE